MKIPQEVIDYFQKVARRMTVDEKNLDPDHPTVEYDYDMGLDDGAVRLARNFLGLYWDNDQKEEEHDLEAYYQTMKLVLKEEECPHRWIAQSDPTLSVCYFCMEIKEEEINEEDGMHNPEDWGGR